MSDSALTFLDGGGKTAELIRALPWDGTGLGPLEVREGWEEIAALSSLASTAA